MSARARALLRDERGQSLVLFVLTMTALFAMLALVVNVGNWLQAKHRVQSVADSAALAAAQEPTQASVVADLYADQNWPGFGVGDVTTSVQSLGQAQEVVVEAKREVPAIFGDLLRMLGLDIISLKLEAQAMARTEVPTTVNQISPIALKCESPCAPWAVGPSGTSAPVSFEFTEGNQISSSFGAVDTIGSDPVADAGIANLQTYLTCDPLVAGSANCPQFEVSVPTAPGFSLVPRLRRDAVVHFDADDLRSALQAAGSWPHLVAVYDDFDVGTQEFRVIGWAAFSFSVDPGDSGPVVHITGTFHKLLVDSSRLSSSGLGGGQYDFGVRAVGLSG